MRRSTFRTRVATVCNKSRPCHKVLGNHLYIVSHNWAGEYHQTGQEQSLSVIIQDKITQVPWHTHKPAHITHTHTLSFLRFVTHLNTNIQTYTHKHTHTNTRLKLFLRSRHKHTHTHTITETTLHENLDRTNYTNTYYVSESQWWFVRNRPYSVWKKIINKDKNIDCLE
jgi:hypothetical protein